MIFQLMASILLFCFICAVLYINLAPQFGSRSRGKSMERIISSPNFNNSKFRNLIKTTMAAEGTSMWKNGIKFIKKDNSRQPNAPVETVRFDKSSFIKNNNGLSFAWFGHSSLIINISGTIILTDPVFSEKASPFSFMGVKRFVYTNQYSVSDMPEIDFILISHDHYDHLDYKTIIEIDFKVKKYLVPLGVAAHLKRWGVNENKIVESDWLENSVFSDKINFISTPARHFSGRAGFDKDRTLWCSWVIKSEDHQVFYCGDSGYGDHFKEIGEKYGPFDLTMMECGQYNEGWPYIHMMPEQSVQAHIDLKGKTMMPIHWGKFNLSLHSWTEPIDRAGKEAKRLAVDLICPKPGEIVEIKDALIERNITKGEIVEMLQKN